MKDNSSAFEKSPYVDKSFIVKLVIAILVVFTALGMYELFLKTFQVFLLGFAAFLWAVLFMSLADWLHEKTKLSHGWSTIISVIIILGIITGIGFLIIPQLSKQLPQFQEKIPQAVQDLKSQLRQLPLGEKLVSELEHPQKLLNKNSDKITSFIQSFFSSVFGFVLDLLVIIVVGFFFLAQPGLYKKMVVKAFPKSRRKRANEVLTNQYIALKSWLAGKIFDMVVVTALAIGGLWIYGVNLAFTLGIIAGLFNFIPNLGPIIALVPALLIAYLQGMDYVIYVFILFNAIQFIESNLLLPLIQQHQVWIPPAVILLTQVLLGVVTGMLGVILAVPILVIIMVFIKMVYLQDILGDTEVQLQSKK